jgi:hydroxyethylthiazole kinase-like uncharacterized protein yjeF
VKPVLSRDQIRAVDQYAIGTLHVPGVVLMENAGRGAAELIERRLRERPGSVVCVCGPGNNGGDGFVVARRLAVRGHRVSVFLAASEARLSGDARTNYDAWLGVGGAVTVVAEGTYSALEAALADAAVVVDALLGTGLDRPVKGLVADVIARINRARRPVVALDVPSGLDSNTGATLGDVVRADETLTFAALKLGLVTSTGAERAGATTVVDIGIPMGAVTSVGASASLLEETDVRAWLSRRPLAAHKGSAGRVVAVAGSLGKTGAALLLARGALRAGAGTVTVCTSPAAADALDHRVLEEMTARLDVNDLDGTLGKHLDSSVTVVMGPGLGLDAEARKIVDYVVRKHAGALVIDADALTHLAGRLSELASAPGRLVLTPHPGEMARLLGVATKDVEQDRFAAVTEAVKRSGAVVLLKGARTLIGAPSVLTVVNPSGCPALATAGSGDVLSGICGAFFAALGDPLRAACAAAFVHGRSAEHWCTEQGGADRGLLAHEIADGVPRVLAALTRPTAPLPV